MALETPISAWQPPIAAEIVAPFLKMLPISPAVSRKRSMPARVAVAETEVVQQHGRDHARGSVGRRRDHPAERAFSSFTARAKQLTHVRVCWNDGRLARIAGDPGVDASGQAEAPSRIR